MLNQLTLQEKCALLTGKEVFVSQGVERLGVSGFHMSDGPNGVRDGAVSMCYPSACLLACSFDVDAAEKIGALLGQECASRGVQLLLGPAQNLKRSPLCGRNFEYYSEDPCLSGELAGHFVQGLQKHTGACVKHFAANNQEYKRMTVDSIIPENALHETYLSSFQRIVEKYKPISIMSSYNRINGEYVGENKALIEDVVRKEWGFDGIVISDWGAIDDKLRAVQAGLDLEMPANILNTEKLLCAVEQGLISESEIDVCVERYLKVLKKLNDYPALDNFDVEQAMQSSAEIAAESMVLLKNDGCLPILPMDKRYRKIGVIGAFAEEPRIQGGGCANVMLGEIEKPLDILRETYGAESILYGKGYHLDCQKDENLLREAEKIVEECDICLLFAGLPEVAESEGYDRESLSIPQNQIDLINVLATKNKPIVVILSNGGMVTMEWDGKVNAVIEGYLAGKAFARAISLVFSGKKSPSGRLAETVLHKKEDSSAYPFYLHKGDIVEYNEGLFVGYKYYNAKGVDVKYPFGYGLGYGKIEYKNVQFTKDKISFTLVNCGSYDDKETVQIYVGYCDGDCARPEAELKYFQKYFVPAGQEISCEIPIDREWFKTYIRKQKKMGIDGGKYNIFVRKNAVETVASFAKEMPSEFPIVYDRNTVIGELLKTKTGCKLVEEELKPYLCVAILGNYNAEIKMKDGVAVDAPMFNNVMRDMPLRALLNLARGLFTEEMMHSILRKLNSDGNECGV